MSVGKTLRFRVFARDGFVCQYCGEQPPKVVLEVDHIHPKSKGGEDEITNLLTSCFDCNRGKRGSLVPAAIVMAQAARAAAEKAEQEAAMLAARAKRTPPTPQIPPPMEPQHPLTLLPFSSIEKRIPISRAMLMKWVREGKFPEPVTLGARYLVWRAVEVDDWIRNKYFPSQPA